MPNFADIASKPVADIERPPLLPVGTYRWRVTKIPEQTSVGQDNQWDVVNFACQVVEVLDNVDREDYKGNPIGVPNRVSFMFDTTDEVKFEQTLFRMKTFLEKHLKVAEAGMAVTEALNASQGAEFLGDIKWRPDKNDQEVFYAEIGNTAPVE